MKQETVKSLFTIAGFEVQNMYELVNKYWPRPTFDRPQDKDTDLHYAKLVLESPWWLVKTQFGLVEIGWRKRVIHISWFDIPFRGEVTSDDTTKSHTMVHAWSELKAAEYLTQLRLSCVASGIKPTPTRE